MTKMPLSLPLVSIFQHKPDDYQECLVYNPCEGFMIATWKRLSGAPAFYVFASYEPLDMEQVVAWMPLPAPEDMDMILSGISIGQQ